MIIVGFETKSESERDEMVGSKLAPLLILVVT